MTTYLVDTDHIIGLIGSEQPIIERMKESVRRGDRFSICATTLSELYWFAKSTAQMDTNTAALTELVAGLPVWEIDRDASEIVGEILLEQQALGRPVSRSVVEVSAISRLRQLVVLSSDSDFKAVRDIRVEDWRTSDRG